MIAWANGVVVSPATFVAASRGSAITADVALSEANVESSSLAQCLPSRTNVSHNSTRT